MKSTSMATTKQQMIKKIHLLITVINISTYVTCNNIYIKFYLYYIIYEKFYLIALQCKEI